MKITFDTSGSAVFFHVLAEDATNYECSFWVCASSKDEVRKVLVNILGFRSGSVVVDTEDEWRRHVRIISGSSAKKFSTTGE